MPHHLILYAVFNLHHAVGLNGDRLMRVIQRQHVQYVTESIGGAHRIFRQRQLPGDNALVPGILWRQAQILGAALHLLGVGIMGIVLNVEFHCASR
ncbi:hypothetical protein D3C80_1100140 [compost metagenome]